MASQTKACNTISNDNTTIILLSFAFFTIVLIFMIVLNLFISVVPVLGFLY